MQKIITKLPENIKVEIDSLTENLRDCGITHIGHGLIVNQKTPSAYFSSPEWAERYGKDDLISRDPIRACALNTNYRIIPWDSILMTRDQRVVLNERKRIFKAKTGVLISNKTANWHETLALGTDSSRHDILDLFTHHYVDILNNLIKIRNTHLQIYSKNENK